MFWRFHLLNSHIDSLLDKEDVTLQEVIDEDDVLQECKAQNRKLIDFLVRPEHLEELVNMVTQEPSDDQEEKVKYKFPNTACELLTSDIRDINDKLAADEALLNKVYSFLELEGPLNPLLASFFSKVMGLLITRKSELMVEFLQAKEDFVGQLLHHLGISAVMDLLLRLITCIDSAECRIQCINWLNDQQLVLKLVQMIDPTQPDEKHCNAAQSLCDIIRLSRENMSQLQEKADPDPLLAAIESQETVAELLNHMFNGEKNESVIVNGLSVIQTLLEFRKVGVDFFRPEYSAEQMTELDRERLAHGVSNTLLALTPRLKDIHQLLLEPPKQHYSAMQTTIGSLDPPLGNARLQVSRLIASLVVNNTHSVHVELARLGTFNVLLDLYHKYMWNNFLHTQVEQCIGTVLSNVQTEGEGQQPETPLVQQLLTECKLVQRILDAWEDNDQQQSRPGGHRRGYMGHLTRIANHLVDNMEKGQNSERIKEIFQEFPDEAREKWETFVSGTLAEMNKQNTVELVGSHALHSSSEDDDPDFRDIPFPQDSHMQQAFSDYQLQQMTSNFIDQFGFNEGEFDQEEDRAEAPFTERISSINFDLNTAEDNPNAASLFEQACNERMHQFDDADSDEELWEEKEIRFFPESRPSGPVTRRGADSGPARSDDSDGSTDSEEELDSPRRIHQTPISTTENMDIDSTANSQSTGVTDWPEVAMDATPVAMDTASPWEIQQPSSSTGESGDSWAKFDESATVNTRAAASTTTGPPENWADFSNFTSLNSTDPGPESSTPVAMDTADSSTPQLGSRTAAYLVSSAPADLCSEVSSANTSTADAAAGDLTPADTTPQINTSSTVEEPSISNGMPAEEVTSAEDVTSAEAVSSDGVSSSTDAQNSKDTSCSPSEAHDEDEEVPLTPRSPPPPHPLAEDDDFDDDDDLSDNFNFLAASGLMRSSDPADNSDISSPDSLDDHDEKTEQVKVDEARAEAKAALEKYAAAAGGTLTQNGPV